MANAWALLATGHGEEAEQCLQAIERTLGTSAEALAGDAAGGLPPDVRGALVEVTALRGVLAVGLFDVPRTLELSRRVLRHLGDSELPGLFNESLELRPVALFNMAQAQELSGQVGTATETFRETAAASLEQKNEHLVWQSVAQHAQAKESEALSVLERAVILAAPEGYCRTFADAGAPVAELLAGLLATGRMDPEGASGGSSPTRITRRIVL